MEYNEVHRALAASCWREAKGDIKVATADFTTRTANLNLKQPADAASFVRRWGQYWDQHGNCNGNASNSGRKRKLPDEDARAVADDLINWQQFEVEGPFSSIRQLQQKSPQSREILQAAEVANSTVTRALSRVAPELSYEKLDIKQKMTHRQKRARYDTAVEHSQVPDAELECVVWVDAKLIYCTIRNRRGWVVHEEKVPYETKRPPGKKSPIKLRYYIGVCARAGKVFLKFVTGTTGFRPQRAYRVSLLLCQPTCSIAGLLSTACCIASSIALRQRRRRPRPSPGTSHST